MYIVDINNIDINDIDKTIDSYTPYLTYGYYDGLYDECAVTIHALGVSSDNELIIARDYDELVNPSFGFTHIKQLYVGYNTVSELKDELINFRSKYASHLPIKIKGYTGKVDDIKEIVIDDELKRVVFVCPENIFN